MQLRPSPKSVPIDSQITPKKRRNLALSATLTLIFAATVQMFVGINNARSVPVKRTAIVHMAALPADMPSVKVALLSDIHLRNLGMTSERLEKIIKQINSEHPDIILIAGDFIIGETSEGAAERASGLTTPLSKLRAPLGVFAVLGNHDNWTVPDVIRANLTKAGIVVLENQAVRRGPFAIVGVGDRFSKHDDLTRSVAAVDQAGGVPIVFSHSPDIALDLPDRFPLLLAGHTHCGQIIMPGFGPVVRYSKWRRLYNPRYLCGRVNDRNRETFVTAGLGSGAIPVRLNAMPDWWLISLHH